MTSTIFIAKLDEVHNIVTADNPKVITEIANRFKFRVNGYQYMPAYKAGRWDGFIKLFKDNKLYVGLTTHLIKLAQEKSWKIELDYSQYAARDFSETDAVAHWNSVGVPDHFIKEPHQIKALTTCIRDRRRLILSATGSGKSMMLYLVGSYLDGQCLIVAPRSDLVDQMEGDFLNYRCQLPIHKIYTGQSKDSNAKFVISTWQSITKQSKEWINRFGTIMIDEAHRAKADQLTKLLEKATKVENRFGFTGSLDGLEVNKLIVEGLLGPSKVVARSSDLIQKQKLAPVTIKIIILHYSDEIKEAMKEANYQTEIDFLTGHEPRNTFIEKLSESITGNVIMSVNQIAHGELLYDRINKTNPQTYWLHGGIKGSERNRIFQEEITESTKNARVIAINKVIAEGTNAPAITDFVFCHPSKARVTIVQSIGRAIRKHPEGYHSTLYDIADNLGDNYTLRHMQERIKIYKEESFPYTIYNVKLK